MYEIYELFNESGVFYVGCTKHLKSRISNHQVRFGKRFGFRVLEAVFSKEFSKVREQYWIDLHKANGILLVNGTNPVARPEYVPHPRKPKPAKPTLQKRKWAYYGLPDRMH